RVPARRVAARRVVELARRRPEHAVYLVTCARAQILRSPRTRQSGNVHQVTGMTRRLALDQRARYARITTVAQSDLPDFPGSTGEPGPPVTAGRAGRSAVLFDESHALPEGDARSLQ